MFRVFRIIFIYIVYLFLLILILSCSTIKDYIDEDFFDSDNNIDITLSRLTFVKKIGLNISNYCSLKGVLYSSQGVSINNGVLYRLFDSGICQSYNLSDINNPLLISTFELASRGTNNHCNCSQFYYDNNTGLLLYISGLRGKCYVEKISVNSSRLIQTISLEQLDIFNNTLNLNIICGDDGYLWLFGDDRNSNTLFFAKARRPAVSEGDVTIRRDDIIDYWSQEKYNYSESVWQGGMVYGGYLYFLFGTSNSKRHIAVYNTISHQLIDDIDLNTIIKEEPEDCDLTNDGHLVIATNGGKGFYLFKLNF